MTIKAAQLVHVGGSRFETHAVLDRIQSITPNLSIPSEKIYEVGSPLTVADVRDTPELSIDVETLDVTTEFEALLLGLDPDAITDGQELNLLDAKPFDIISPWTTSLTNSAVASGLAYPYLTLESATYRFGVGQNSTQAFTLRGDSIYYIPGSPYFETFAAAGTGPYTLAHTAIETVESGDSLFAYCVTQVLADGTYRRLVIGEDYTNTSTVITLAVAAPVDSFLHVVYGSATADDYPQGDHQGVSVKPAAVKGKNIDVYVSDGAATPQMVRWFGVQTAEFTWRLALEAVRELGNDHVVEQTYDAPELSGTFSMKPASISYLRDRLSQITGVATNKTINALSSVPLDVEVRISHPTTGDVLKTFLIDEARFTPPSLAAQANTRIDVPFAFTSDTGQLKVVKAAPL